MQGMKGDAVDEVLMRAQGEGRRVMWSCEKKGRRSWWRGNRDVRRLTLAIDLVAVVFWNLSAQTRSRS